MTTITSNESYILKALQAQTKKGGLLEGYEANLRTIDKPSGSYNTIGIKKVGAPIEVNIKVELLLNGTLTVAEACKQAIAGLEDFDSSAVSSSLEAFNEYKKIKPLLTVRLVSTANQQFLSRAPHKLLEDMAIVYYVAYDNSHFSPVTNEMLERFGVTPEELHDDAVKNSFMLYPAEFVNLADFLRDALDLDDDGVGMPIWVGTNSEKFYGASVVLQKEFLECVSEKLEGSFFIIPSSVHEVLFIPDNGFIPAEAIRPMIAQVNQTEVSPSEVLSDSLFYYDAESKEFRKAN